MLHNFVLLRYSYHCVCVRARSLCISDKFPKYYGGSNEKNFMLRPATHTTTLLQKLEQAVTINLWLCEFQIKNLRDAPNLLLLGKENEVSKQHATMAFAQYFSQMNVWCAFTLLLHSHKNCRYRVHAYYVEENYSPNHKNKPSAATSSGVCVCVCAVVCASACLWREDFSMQHRKETPRPVYRNVM